jgi:hypothetical protein
MREKPADRRIEAGTLGRNSSVDCIEEGHIYGHSDIAGSQGIAAALL